MSMLIPFYWKTYGPINFLYMCDLALFLTLGAVWFESGLMAGMAAVGILLAQCVWIFDICIRLITGYSLGMTEYMFKGTIPVFAKFLSLYHLWMPVLLVYLILKKGYDRRSLVCWTSLIWSVMIICYLFTLPPPPDPANPNSPVDINYVFGFSPEKRQTLMHPHLYVASLMLELLMFIYIPTHIVLKKIDLRMKKGARNGIKT